ncbi:hypothetical protein COOONC_07796 [Cooperia oncophora]
MDLRQVKMLGMMNSPADTVEFYAARKSTEDGADQEDLKVFREAKHKRSVSYTQDGRRMIDGKIEGGAETATNLWEKTLRIGALTTHMIASDDDCEGSADRRSTDQAKSDCSETPECVSPVVVYAINKSLGEGLSEESMKAFTEVKPRQTVTYTQGQYSLVKITQNVSAT